MTELPWMTPWMARCHYAAYIHEHKCVPSARPPVELPVIATFNEWRDMYYSGKFIIGLYHYWCRLDTVTYKLTRSMVCLVAPLYSPRLHIGTYLPADLFRKLMLFLTCSWGND